MFFTQNWLKLFVWFVSKNFLATVTITLPIFKISSGAEFSVKIADVYLKINHYVYKYFLSRPHKQIPFRCLILLIFEKNPPFSLLAHCSWWQKCCLASDNLSRKKQQSVFGQKNEKRNEMRIFGARTRTKNCLWKLHKSADLSVIWLM